MDCAPRLVVEILNVFSFEFVTPVVHTRTIIATDSLNIYEAKTNDI